MVVLGLLGLNGPAMAQPADVERAILQLSVNGVERGEVVVVVRSPDVLIRPADLQRAGLIGLAGRRETIADARGQPYERASKREAWLAALSDRARCAPRRCRGAGAWDRVRDNASATSAR